MSSASARGGLGAKRPPSGPAAFAEGVRATIAAHIAAHTKKTAFTFAPGKAVADARKTTVVFARSTYELAEMRSGFYPKQRRKARSIEITRDFVIAARSLATANRQAFEARGTAMVTTARQRGAVFYPRRLMAVAIAIGVEFGAGCLTLLRNTQRVLNDLRDCGRSPLGRRNGLALD